MKYKGFNGLSKGSTTEKMRNGWIGFLLDYEKWKSRWNFKWILFYEEQKKIGETGLDSYLIMKNKNLGGL